MKQAGIASGFLSSNFVKKVYPKGFGNGFQFPAFRSDDTGQVQLDKHMYDKDDFENDLSEMGLEEWKLNSDHVKSVYEMAKELGETQIELDRLQESLRTRDGETLDDGMSYRNF